MPCTLFLDFLFFFMMNMLVWYGIGAGNRRFPTLIRDYAKIYNLSFLAILEPRISGVRADYVISKLGFDGVICSYAIGFSGGLCCLWKKARMAVDVMSISKYYILLKMNPRSLQPWLLSIVYGSPQERHKENLWNELREIHQNYNLPWCVVGDFNAVLHPHEKEGGSPFNQRVGQSFAQCIFDCNLVDLGFKGPLFTWRSGALQERLDRALGNVQ